MLRLYAPRLAARVLTPSRVPTSAHSLSLLLRHQSTLSQDPSSTTTPSTAPSRWQLLKRKRRLAPTPDNRTAYDFNRKLPVPLSVALSHVRAAAWAKFDESLELVFRLNIDPRQPSENVRGSLSLPHGTGRDAKVAVFADGLAAKEAREAGAELVGGQELVDQLKAVRAKTVKGFEACVAVPELLPMVAAGVGKVLGPKGLMPAKKDGTVGGDVGEIVRRLKKGQVKYRTDRAGNVHLIVGKLSFSDEMIEENVGAATRAIMEARPMTLKKKYMQKASVCSSMGPSVVLDLDKLVRLSSQQA